MSGEEPFDANASALAIQETVRGIQRLLRTYETQTRQLREEVESFIKRDDAEQEQMRVMTNDVIRTEMECLQNKAYVTFSRIRQQETVEQRLLLKDDSASLTTALGAWAPSGYVMLSHYPTLHSATHGMTLARQNDACDEQVAELVEALYGTSKAELVLFCNGILWHQCPAIEMAPKVLDYMLYLLKPLLNHLTASSCYLCYTNAVYKAALLMSMEQLVNAVHFNLNRVDELHLTHDGCDSLVVVPLERMFNTLTFRAFFIRGELAAVEHMGAHINVYAVMQGSMTMVQQRIADAFKKIYTKVAPCMQEGKSIVIIAAFHNVTYDGIVLHVCKVGPTLPYMWQLSWPEVCALGQLRSEGKPREVVFKCPQHEPVELTPYDALSVQCFRSVNVLVHKLAEQDGDTSVAVFGTVTKIIAVLSIAALVRKYISKRM